MAREVFMPKAGMDMQEGVIVRWLVDIGQPVAEGDALLEIETDKVNMEIESPADGVLLCKYYEDGDIVPVVTVIGYVGQPGEQVPDRPIPAGFEGGEHALSKGAEPSSMASAEHAPSVGAEPSSLESIEHAPSISVEPSPMESIEHAPEKSTEDSSIKSTEYAPAENSRDSSMKRPEHAPDDSVEIDYIEPPGDARDPFLPPLGQRFDYDVAVIGGGPAGYVAAIKAAMMGGKVVLFEKDTLGGTCLNRGCIPTKTYLKTAEYLRNIKQAGKRGIVVDDAVSVDMPRVYAYKQKVVKKLTGGVAALLKSRGVTVIKGEARLKESWVVECEGRQVTAASVILCGGSKPGRIDIPGIDHERVLDSDGILELQHLPDKLAVIGGGAVGCELATVFAGFGSKVSIIEMADRLVPEMDAEISSGIAKAMKGMGVTVHTSKCVKAIEPAVEGVSVKLADGSIDADYVLLSTERVADTDCLGALADFIMTEKGRVIVDEYCQTNIQNVYACGDITTASTLAHAAFKMGEAAASTAMGSAEQANLQAVPSCLYTKPEAAGVGLSENEARSRGNIMVGRFPFAANGRAISSGEPEGFVKVVADSKYGEILGVHILGANATEMIAEAKLMIDMEITVYEMANTMHAHPTFSESLMEACADALGKSIHLP